MRRSRGFSMFELIVVVIVLGVIAAILLNRLSFYQEAAEKANMEYTVSLMKSTLRVRMANMLINGRAQEYASLAQENPMDWLEEKPANYMGAFKGAAPAHMPAGSWYFDSASRTVIYQVERGNHFEPDSTGQKRVRLQVKLTRSSVGDTAGNTLVVGVSLVLVEPYRWF